MNLATNYLGLTLKNPLIASSSPVNLDIANIRRLEDAIVLPSIFEEEIEQEMAEVERLTSAGMDSFAEARAAARRLPKSAGLTTAPPPRRYPPSWRRGR